MFRKSLNIIIASILLISTTGFTVSKHYCGSTLVSMTLNSEAESCCGMNGSYCHNESDFFQVDDDFSSNIQKLEIEYFAFVFKIIENYSFQNIIQEYYNSILLKPPGNLLSKVTKLTCCFLL